jgi:hypothetical protein
VVFGILSYYYLDNGHNGVSISSVLLVTSASFFVTLLWKMFYKPHEKTHTEEYANWLSESNLANKYEYATYADIRPKKQSKSQLERLLGQIEYPASKRDVIKYAEGRSASSDTLTRLENLPDHIYDSAEAIKNKL